MKKLLLLLSFCFYATIYNVATAAESVLWEEDFSSYSAGAVPTGGLYSYSCTVSGTKIYDANLAGSTSPELLIAKNGGTFSATIPMNGISGEMTLSFYSNRKITITATNATIGETTISGKQCSCIVKVAEGVQSITLEFKNTDNKNNVRFDSVKLAQELSTQVDYITVDPAFGEIVIGEKITVDCQTEGAVLNGKIGNNVNITNESFPYTYTIQESDLDKTLDCVFEASKGELTSSKLEGTYTVVAPAAEQPTFSLEDYDEVYIVDEVGNITNEKVVITGTAGCSLSLTVNGTEVETVAASDAVPTIEYTFNGDPCEKFTLVAKTTNKYNGAAETTAHYIIASTSKLMGELTADKTTLSGTSYATFSPAVVAGGVFAGVASKNSGLQFNTNANGKNSETYMTYSIGDIQSVSLTFGDSGAGNILEVYGSNTPYSYDKSVDKSNGTGQLWKKETRGTLIKEITSAANQTVTFNVPWDYQYIGIRSQAGAIVVASLKVIWRTGVDGLDVSYDKVTEASLVSGKFSVLAAMNGSNTTFARNEGVATVELGDDGNISLLKGQITVDEFEINGNQDLFTLCGGLGEIDAENNTRTYLAVDADNNVIRVQDNASAANFKLELENGQVLVKFDGGEYLAYNGTNFVKTATIGEGYTAVNIFVNGSGVSTGVEAVEIEDADAPVEYYNLQGVRVANPQNGLYIVRQGNKVSKQIIR